MLLTTVGESPRAQASTKQLHFCVPCLRTWRNLNAPTIKAAIDAALRFLEGVRKEKKALRVKTAQERSTARRRRSGQVKAQEGQETSVNASDVRCKTCRDAGFVKTGENEIVSPCPACNPDGYGEMS